MSTASLVLNQTYAALRKYGAKAILSRVETSGEPDPVTGDALATETTCQTFAVLDGSSQKGLGFKFGESLVQGGDMQVTIPAKGMSFEPKASDTFTVLSKVHKVVDVRPTYVGDVPVKFDLLIRR
jgi:hypothetical protein